jgi:hypothetical protein
VRYFRSHGPAARADFTGWTGMTAGDSVRGIALAGDALARVEVRGKEMFVARDRLDEYDRFDLGSGRRLALPGFDEFMLGFKDRSLMAAPAVLSAVVPGGNGVFQATIVRDGRVMATWKRSQRRNKTVVEVRPLKPVTAAERARVEAVLHPYGQFVDQPLEVRWP